MRYLGLVLDGRWEFRAHFQRLMPKLLGAAGALGYLLPNLGGPKASCRRLYLGVVRSMALYGAPVWANTLKRQNIALLNAAQRAMAIRVIRGYRTISCEAARVLAGSLPWDLDARALSSMYFWREEAHGRGDTPAPREVQAQREEVLRLLLLEWEQRLAQPSAGLRTIQAVRPVLRQWLDRQHGVMTFRLTQILSGHGCFGRYLHVVAGREPTAECHHCGGCPEDTAQHTLEACPAWATERQELGAVVGRDLSLPAVVQAMVDSERSWKAVLAFCEAVLRSKEDAEREREATATDPARRRRPGRRRRADVGRLPP
ncbi:uncharacterized protein LOC126375411 [Pectinophora gossypiella]|uniref:uncharacterized protein LOC126375411 n=1 Tax=Pectinophora gossypiella TaxID=13191 RepID=UPI00214E5047|nr:uncharacterized protein LOC126375411 [Pectinophora gossypiella]